MSTYQPTNQRMNEIEHRLKPPPPIRPKPSCYKKTKFSLRKSPSTVSAPLLLTAVRTSSSTSSSETPLSPAWNNKPNTESHHRPKPRKFSIPGSTHEEDDTSSPPASPSTHVYPSPPYKIDPKTILIPPPPAKEKALYLHELVDKYSQSFPLQIKVLHGYNGPTTQLTISSGDYYNVHFVKHQDVVSMNDKLGFSYTIPLNSSFQFGLVYTETTSTQNSIYEKVADLLVLSPLPKVACATTDARGSDERNSIAADEILVLKRVIRPKLRKKSLEVLSLKTQSTKILPLDCAGHFTLKPNKNKIYLLELVKCIPDVFPCMAIMFLSSDAASNQQKTSHSLLNAVVTLNGQKKETSLIASSVTYTSCEDQSGEIAAQVSEHLVDIPVDDRLSRVIVKVVDTSECGLQEILNSKTRTLFETFDVTRVRSWYNDTTDQTQNILYATIGRGSEGIGIHVDKPLAAFNDSPSVDSLSSTDREEALYATVYSPCLDDIDSESTHQLDYPNNEYATQYEQPHNVISIQPTNNHSPAGISYPHHHSANVRSEVHYDPLPPLSRVGNRLSKAAHKSLRRSRSQYTLPAITDVMTDCYEDMHPRVPSPFTSHYNPQYNTDSKLEQLLVTTTSLHSQLGDLMHRMSRVEGQLKDITEMNIIMKSLLEKLSTIQASQLHGMQDHSMGLTVHPSQNEAQQNKYYLKTLTLTQVIFTTLCEIIS